MASLEEKLNEAAQAARSEATFLALGKHRREIILLGSGSEEEATEFARNGVLQSKFSDTFVIPCAAHFNEQGIRWANPDGVKHEPAQGAQLNPEGSEQEPTFGEKQAQALDLASPVSKTELKTLEAEEQIRSGASVDTGAPDVELHRRSGENPQKTSAFDSASTSTAKSGEVSSSQAKGTEQKVEAKK